MRTATRPQKIKPETICIGDILRLTYKLDDVDCSKVGTVAERDHHNQGTDYLTASGQVLFTRFRSGHTEPANVNITLIKREIPTLF